MDVLSGSESRIAMGWALGEVEETSWESAKEREGGKREGQREKRIEGGKMR
jgi:hypothetical protein